MKSKVEILPLGGIREKGENLYAVVVNGGIYILDCGLRYPTNEMLGIDVIIPDVTYLKQNRNRIVGVFLTHGHEEAIGALPYFLKEFNVPVFGSKFTIAMAEHLVHSHCATRKFNKFNVINPNSEIIFRDVVVTFFNTTHSIPGSMGIVLNTKEGQIVYTGNFKFDPTVYKNYRSNLIRIGEVGKKGVLALLSDSANAENYHENVPELKIDQYLTYLFSHRKNRIIVGCQSSNLLRIQQIFNAAFKAHRKVCLMHPRLEAPIIIGLKYHQLTLPAKGMLVNPKNINSIDKSKLVILETGKMGESLKALRRMASQQNGSVNIKPNDLVIIATEPNHSMEVQVAETKDAICRAEGIFRMITDEFNVTDNASRRDMQMIIDLLHPKYLIPVLGEYRVLKAYKRLAIQMGFPKDHIITPSKGSTLVYNGHRMNYGKSVPAGDTIVDGSGVGDVGNIVLRDRKVLSEDGIFIAVVTIDHKTGKVVADPQIKSRGFIYVSLNRALMNKSAQLVKHIVQKDLSNGQYDWSYLKKDIRDVLSNYLYKATTHHPVIMPVIMEINHVNKESD